MSVFQLIQDNLAYGGNLVSESERASRGQKQIAIGVNPAAEVEGGTGEVVTITVTKDAELERRKQGDFDCAGEVDRCSRSINRSVVGSLTSRGSPSRSHLQIERYHRCYQPLVVTRADDVPGTLGIAQSIGERPSDVFNIIRVGNARTGNGGGVVGGTGQSLDRGGIRSLGGLVQQRELGSHVLNARLSAIVGDVALKVVAAHALFIG